MRECDFQRVGHVDRDVVLGLLAGAADLGYLDVHEYEQRSQDAAQAKIISQLRPVLADLPAEFHWDPAALLSGAGTGGAEARPPTSGTPAPRPGVGFMTDMVGDRAQIAAGIVLCLVSGAFAVMLIDALLTGL